MLKHDAGRVSHSEDRSNVEQIQRAVGPLGQLFRTSFFIRSRNLCAAHLLSMRRRNREPAVVCESRAELCPSGFFYGSRRAPS